MCSQSAEQQPDLSTPRKLVQFLKTHRVSVADDASLTVLKFKAARVLLAQKRDREKFCPDVVGDGELDRAPDVKQLKMVQSNLSRINDHTKFTHAAGVLNSISTRARGSQGRPATKTSAAEASSTG